jgi:lysophospholipase L1-like esterase
LKSNRRRLSALVAAVLGLVVAVSGCTGATKTSSPVRVGSIAAMGDSISRAFDGCTFLQDCLRTSWVTGTDPAVQSHYQRLVARNPALSGRAFNEAKVGATSADLPRQAASVATRRPDYVTILIGANDACAVSESAMTSRAVFRARIDQALTTIYRARPDSKVFVASIPDIYRLWQVAHTNQIAQIVWSAGFCRSMLDNPTSTAAYDAARRQRVRNQVIAYNGELAAACRAHTGCRFDDNAVFNYPFAIGDLSPFDYFHPNARGQKIISTITWPKTGL